MATKYFRLSGWWGEIEAYTTDEQVYSAAQRKPLGANATPPGIGVRRCQLVFSRAPGGSTEDVATTHLDFQNLTAGVPDDTWTAGDFAALEPLIDTWWGSIKPKVWSQCHLREYRWYRIGPGIAPPNPPVRITTMDVAGTGTAPLPPQVAVTVTFKTAVRREWGRIYLPAPAASTVNTASGRIVTADAVVIADATDVLMGAAAAADFLPVVYGRTRGKVYSVESIQVDDVFDVIRSRRWDRPLVRTVRS